MGDRVSEPLLCLLSAFVADRMGLYFPRERWPDLERGIRSATREFQFDNVESCVRWLVSSTAARRQIEVLASHLTVGETYFFREPRSFEVLQARILPELIGKRRGRDQRLRIWTAGCCTGEEPYSIAMLLRQVLPDINDWRITILATDINPKFLEKAADGVYGEWSFRDVPAGIKERYFSRKRNNRFALLPDIKKMVTLGYLNLAQDPYPSLWNDTNAMDVIFCRNVLMYFTPERMRRVVHQLSPCLVNGGWLVVSPAEASSALVEEFEPAHFPGAAFYRKGGAPGRAAFPVHKVDREAEGGIPMEEPAESRTALEVDQPEAERTPKDSYVASLAHDDGGQCAEAPDGTLPGLLNDSEDPQAMAFFARSYANAGELPKALELSERALALDKLNPGLHYLRAMILQEMGWTDAAMQSLKRALYLDQNHVLCYVALGNLARGRGQLEESARYFENALSLLHFYGRDEILPESDGMTVGRLMEVIDVYRGRT